MPSASVRGGVAAASCVVALTGLTACQTTQETAALKAISSARQLDDHPVTVTKSNPQVKVTEVTLLRGKSGSAVAVGLRNAGKKPVNDLPISVGVTQSGKQVLLNEKAGGQYFKNHAPALAPGKSTTFVFTTDDKLKDAAAPFARVGFPAKKPPTVAHRIPVVKVTEVRATKGPSPSVTVSLENTTGRPQYQITAYAWSEKKGRYVAAGRSGTTDLGTHDTDNLTIPLIGDADPSAVKFAAPATIFN